MIYLDNAATSYPKPTVVYDAVDRILRTIGGNPGRASHRMALEASRVIFESRERLAKLLGVADSSRVAFTKNATEAINLALKGLVSPGDHVVSTTFEHNSVARTLRRLEKEGVKITRVEGATAGILTAAEIGEAIREDTKLVTIVHASNVFGTILPVDEIGAICREKGVLFMVDGAQTAGALPLDIDNSNIDIFVGTGHKALFGAQGTGFIYLREGIEPPPLVDGGTGEVDDILEIPDRLEAGTMNMPGIGGLGEGVAFVLEAGVDNIRAKEMALVDILLTELPAIDGINIIGPLTAEERMALVSFTVEGVDPQEVGRRLDEEYEIMVRCGTHCAPEAHMRAGTFPEGTVRVSPGYFTEEDQILKLLDAVKIIAAT